MMASTPPFNSVAETRIVVEHPVATAMVAVYEDGVRHTGPGMKVKVRLDTWVTIITGD